MDNKKKNVRRSPRIKPFSLEDVKFTLDDHGRAHRYKVINLSMGGIGFERAAGDIWPNQNEVVSGTVTIEEKPFPITIRIMRKDDSTIGGKFEGHPTDLIRMIQQHFQPEMSAQELTKVTDGILREQPDGTPHWYFDGAGGELYFVETAGRITRYRINFSTISVEGTPEKPPTITEEVEDELLGREANSVMQEKIMRFLNNVNGLEPEYFDKLSELITGIR